MKLEFHGWKSSRFGNGVLAIDIETGVAVFVKSESSHQGNQKLAEERVKLLLAEATSPGGWI
jgi:hypothetical protein